MIFDLKNEQKKILIITPVYLDEIGGASIYFKSLVSHIKDIFNIYILSEKTHLIHDNYFGILPKRSSVSYRSYLHKLYLFFLENLSYIKIIYCILKVKPEIIHVHSSFYNNFSCFKYIFRICLKLHKANYILDIRDQMFREKNKNELVYYNHIICCSQKILKKMQNLNNIKFKVNIHYIPVCIKNKKIIEDKSLEQLIQKKEYLLYVGLIKDEKNVHNLIETFEKHITKDLKNLYLILVGIVKNNKKKYYEKFKHKKIIHIEKLENNKIQYLIKHSKMCINISTNEGIPQFSLESLSQKIPTILPPFIDEFDSKLSEFVFNGKNNLELSKLVKKILSKNMKPIFSIENHLLVNNIDKYKYLYESK